MGLVHALQIFFLCALIGKVVNAVARGHDRLTWSPGPSTPLRCREQDGHAFGRHPPICWVLYRLRSVYFLHLIGNAQFINAVDRLKSRERQEIVTRHVLRYRTAEEFTHETLNIAVLDVNERARQSAYPCCEQSTDECTEGDNRSNCFCKQGRRLFVFQYVKPIDILDAYFEAVLHWPESEFHTPNLPARIMYRFKLL